jgi:hypothetical protein
VLFRVDAEAGGTPWLQGQPWLVSAGVGLFVPLAWWVDVYWRIYGLGAGGERTTVYSSDTSSSVKSSKIFMLNIPLGSVAFDIRPIPRWPIYIDGDIRFTWMFWDPPVSVTFSPRLGLGVRIDNFDIEAGCRAQPFPITTGHIAGADANDTAVLREPWIFFPYVAAGFNVNTGD